MRRPLVPLLAAALLGVPAVAFANDNCAQSVKDVRGTQPTRSEVSQAIDSAAATHQVPVVVLRAIAYVESGWRQFNADGTPLLSNDTVCGVGIMQVTAGEYGAEDQVRLAADYQFNVDQGAKILHDKWLISAQTPPPAGAAPDDPDVIENWYRAIHLYNGDSAGTVYPDKVANVVHDPFRYAPNFTLRPYYFTKPQEADPSYAYPGAFQARYSPAREFVFYNHTTGVVTKTVPAATHDVGVVPMPVTGYGVAQTGPDDAVTTCAQCGGWRLSAGDGVVGRARWTNSVTGPSQSTLTWRPSVSGTGRYRVAAYVPAIGTDTLSVATYDVAGQPVTIDQNAAKDAWRGLGDFTLTAGDTVTLGDSASVAGRKIVADALRARAIPTIRLVPYRSTITYGGSTYLRLSLAHSTEGTYSRDDYRARLYKRRLGTSAWSYVGAYRLSGTENWIPVKPTVNAEYQARFTSPDPYYESANSAIARIRVAPKVTMGPSSLSVGAGESATYSIAVSPAHSGQRVLVQRLVSGGWQSVAWRTLGTTGRTSYTATKSRGTYYYRVHKPADSDHVSATSNRVTLTVR